MNRSLENREDQPVPAPWRERLRAGDPASDIAPLAPEETQAMLRAMLGTLPEERHRSPWRVPLLAATALAALGLLVAGLALWHRPLGSFAEDSMPQRASVPPSESSRPVPSSEANPTSAGGDSLGGPTEPSSQTAAVGRSASSVPGQRQGGRADSPAALDASAAPVPAPAGREIQFSTPGGTRIVWVLASGDAPASATPRPSRL